MLIFAIVLFFELQNVPRRAEIVANKAKLHYLRPE